MCTTRSVSALARQEFAGVGEGGVVDPAGEHPGELAAAFFALDFMYPGERAPVGGGLGDDEVGLCLRGYLGQVRYRQNLVALSELAQFRPDRRRSLPTYPGIDLVEDIRGAGLDAFLSEPNGEHNAAEFPPRGVAPHRQLRLAGVRLDRELHSFAATRPQGGFDQLRPEGRPPEVQVSQVLLYLCRKLLGGSTTALREGVPQLLELGLALSYAPLELRRLLLEVLHAGEAVLCIREVPLDVLPVFALQRPQSLQPVLDGFEAVRVGLELVEVGSKLVDHVYELRGESPYTIQEPREARVVAGGPVQLRLRHCESVDRAPLLARERRRRGRGGGQEVRHVPQAVPLAHEVAVLGGAVARLLQLRHLVAKKIDLPYACLRRPFKLCKLPPIPLDPAPQLIQGRLYPQRLLVQKVVQDGELLGGVDETGLFSLAVVGDQPFAKRRERLYGYRDPAHVAARTALLSQRPSQQDLFVYYVHLLGEVAQSLAKHTPGYPIREHEGTFDGRPPGARAHRVGSGARSEEHLQRGGEQGLARARLAGNRVQAGGELERGLLDQGHVFDSDLREHCSSEPSSIYRNVLRTARHQLHSSVLPILTLS